MYAFIETFGIFGGKAYRYYGDPLEALANARGTILADGQCNRQYSSELRAFALGLAESAYLFEWRRTGTRAESWRLLKLVRTHHQVILGVPLYYPQSERETRGAMAKALAELVEAGDVSPAERVVLQAALPGSLLAAQKAWEAYVSLAALPDPTVGRGILGPTPKLVG